MPRMAFSKHQRIIDQILPSLKGVKLIRWHPPWATSTKGRQPPTITRKSTCRETNSIRLQLPALEISRQWDKGRKLSWARSRWASLRLIPTEDSTRLWAITNKFRRCRGPNIIEMQPQSFLQWESKDSRKTTLCRWFKMMKWIEPLGNWTIATIRLPGLLFRAQGEMELRPLPGQPLGWWATQNHTQLNQKKRDINLKEDLHRQRGLMGSLFQKLLGWDLKRRHKLEFLGMTWSFGIMILTSQSFLESIKKSSQGTI